MPGPSGSTYTTAGGNDVTNILGTITNNDTFLLTGGGGANATVNLGANTTLSGGGKVTLSTAGGGGNAVLQGNGFTLTNTNNTIQGAGIIGNGSLAVVNGAAGTIASNAFRSH